MENYAFLIAVACLAIIVILGKVFSFSIKRIIKLMLNSILGTGLMYVINIFGEGFNFHIGINWWTIIFTGLFGIPGVILIVVLKLFL